MKKSSEKREKAALRPPMLVLTLKDDRAGLGVDRSADVARRLALISDPAFRRKRWT